MTARTPTGPVRSAGRLRSGIPAARLAPVRSPFELPDPVRPAAALPASVPASAGSRAAGVLRRSTRPVARSPHAIILAPTRKASA
ncbi:hypothetical protein Q5425_11820 [Amycolatopsis sp. A133]|uniref:hypothetical protein n=1 Tax=Amycolatopsis sp. A133 TaxID=3064472 RepID=UPI0027FC5029|nr:hypothetical protein [Amycolatopsis sp. A133]MDQ7804424.1 hypothetical protein [Amycolatopsis sp. A133]